MDTPALTLFAKLHDKKLAARFKAALERNGHSMKYVLTAAAREYVAKSEAAAQQAAQQPAVAPDSSPQAA